MNIMGLWKMPPGSTLDPAMSNQEVVLEFRLSSPNAFECSACRELGNRKLFPAILSTEELVVAFKEHVESQHASLA